MVPGGNNQLTTLMRRSNINSQNPVNRSIVLGGGSQPNQIAGLAMWMRADSELVYTDAGTTPATNGQAVQQWNCNVSGCAWTQATALNKPTFITGAINSLPVLRFDGTNSFMDGDAISKTFTTGYAGLTFFVVGKSAVGTLQVWAAWSRASSAAARVTFQRSTSSEALVFRILNADSNTTVSTPIASYNTNNYIVSHAQDVSGQTATIYQNGVAGPTGTAGYTNPTYDNTACFTTPLMGQQYGGINRLNGDIAEIILYSRVLSSTERRTVEKYLSNKYAIAVT